MLTMVWKSEFIQKLFNNTSLIKTKKPETCDDVIVVTFRLFLKENSGFWSIVGRYTSWTIIHYARVSYAAPLWIIEFNSLISCLYYSPVFFFSEGPSWFDTSQAAAAAAAAAANHHLDPYHPEFGLVSRYVNSIPTSLSPLGISV